MSSAAAIHEIEASIERSIAEAVRTAHVRASAAALKQIEEIVDRKIAEILNGEKDVRWVRACVVMQAKGYTEEMLREKRRRGVWCEGIEFIKAPDGKFRYDIRAVEKWEESA